MKNLKPGFLIFFMIPTIIYAQQKQVNIIPTPVYYELKEGNFVFDNSVSVQFQSTNKELQKAWTFFKSAINQLSGIDLPANSPSQKGVHLALGSYKEIGTEGYLLHISEHTISIEANTKTGIIYGIQTLLQLLPAIRTNAELIIPCMEIKDYPRFKWRGMHLDVSRHFWGPDFIKEYIDLLAAYKLNTFHWHLTDDQGWRIEIKKYPLLTQTGAWRVDQNDKEWESRPQAKAGEPSTYGGYYTQEQIKEIIQYAAERNVTIVPEIEMPGHSAAAIASYPFLSCNQLPQLPMTGGNYSGISSSFCAGNDSVFTFLQNVLSEVIELFPSKFIHIGGDEVDKVPWKNCIKCQLRIKNEHLHNEEELQSYFIRRIENFVSSKSRKIVGWDEILEGGLAHPATVMSWRGEAGGVQAAKMKQDVVMTPGTPCYFDFYQAGPEGEPVAFGGFNTLQKVYNYEPIPSHLEETDRKYVLGAQANLWTEYITTVEQVEYMVLPRLLALSEVVWSPKENRNWENFNERLKAHFRRFEQKGIRYCPGNYTVNIKPVFENGKLTAILSNEIMNSTIYYTTDGAYPDIQSNKYNTPINIDSSTTLRAITVLNGKVMGLVPAIQKFVFHKSIGKTVSYENPVSSLYFADGPNTLTDGIRGKFDIGKYWHGFYDKDFIATINLGEVKTISSITLGCLQKYRDWIFLPQWVKFEISADGISYFEIQTVQNPISINQPEIVYDFKANFAPTKARYIRVLAKNNLCPPEHSGAGKPGWIFADEIMVN